MASLSKRWQVAPLITSSAAQELKNYNRILAQLLFNRTIETASAAEAYLAARLSQSDDPLLLQDMQAAVSRIAHAIAHGEHIAVYGDYDVDGVTATALLTQLLENYGARVTPYIPRRFEEGYGLNVAALDKLHSQGVALVITVDCGIRALEEASHAQRIGLDLIVSDHHHVGAELPLALAVINPKREDDTYPEKMLAGVGLAYKLAQGLLRTVAPPVGIVEEDFLDLVALGTVADLAPLIGENRVLVRRGLQVLNRDPREGIKSLIHKAGLRDSVIRASNIGFQLGPRLNAAGRLASAATALNLLTTYSEEVAERRVHELEEKNRERRQLTLEATTRAREALSKGADQPLLFVAHPSFNAGVVGLVASRLADEFYRPAFVAKIRENDSVGSARSIPGFSVHEALDDCADLLEQYGGHEAAAGFTVPNAKRAELAARLRKYASDKLDVQKLRPTLNYDIEVGLNELSFELVRMLEDLEPCGYGNLSPVFMSRDVVITDKRIVGRDNKHLRLKVRKDSAVLDAIAFGMAEEWGERLSKGERIDLVFELEINKWKETMNLQLKVKDLREPL